MPESGSTPPASSADALARMRRQRRRDTQPEVALRRELHRLGVRYRVDEAPLQHSRRRADVVFRSARVAVYVQGCFWHGCPEHMTWPSANADWWKDKIEANIARDRDTDRRLGDAGWLAIRVWEHEDPKLAAVRIAEIVRTRRLTRLKSASSRRRGDPRRAGRRRLSDA